MSHTHGPGGGHHRHGSVASAQRPLAIALGLALAYAVAELAGSWLTGSLALLADAGHMVSDAAALGLALFAAWAAARPSGPRLTYGRARLEILAALGQGVALVALALLISVEAVERMAAPPPVAGGWVMLVAAGGLAVNGIALRVLDSGRHKSLNLRGAWLHVAGDTLASAGALVSGALVALLGWTFADPVASIAISVLVLWSAGHLLRDAVDVLMEAAPRGLDIERVRAALFGIPSVTGVHDLHVWSVGHGRVALSCHVVVPEDGRCTPLLSDAYAVLGERFGIDHATIQVEPQEFANLTPQAVCAGRPAARDCKEP